MSSWLWLTQRSFWGIYSILVLFVQEEFFEIEAEREMRRNRGCEGESGLAAFGLVFFDRQGKELTLWRVFAKTFLRTFWSRCFYATP
jgi:hypothetical protein